MIKEIKDKTLKTEKVEWKKLLPLQGDNTKTIFKTSYERLRNSLLNNSFIDPLNVWETEEGIYILDGHHRIKALFNLENEGVSIPEKLTANFIDCEDRKEAAKVLLLACSDYAKLENEGLYEFISLEEVDFEDLKMEADLPEIDFEEFEKCFYTEPEGEKEELDDTPEVKEDAISKLGDLFLIDGKHRVLCGDSTKEEDVKRLMDGNSAELLFTSPPYSDMREYEGNKNLEIDNLINFISVYYEFANFQVVNLGIKRKDNEIVEYWQNYINKAKETGYKFLSWNVWDKMLAGSISNQGSMFAIEHEWMFVFGKQVKKINRTVEKSESSEKRLKSCRKNIEGKLIRRVRQSDGSMKYSIKGENYLNKNLPTIIQVVPQMGRDAFTTKHPAIFPVDLPKEYIKAMTDEEEFIIDPFLGSGSTLIAANETKRICYGMELEPKYIDVILKRYKKLYPESTIECLNNKDFDFKELFKDLI